MNSKFLKCAIVAFLVINLCGWIYLISRGGDHEETAVQNPPEPVQQGVPAQTEMKPFALLSCEQSSMSSNRIAMIRLKFNSAVDTNSVLKKLSFKADGKTVAYTPNKCDNNYLYITLQSPVEGNLVTAVLESGAESADKKLMIPSKASATVGCALSPLFGLLSAKHAFTKQGHNSIILSFNQPVDVDGVSSFIKITPEIEFSTSEYYDYYSENAIRISADFEPKNKYSVTIEAGAKSDNGQCLRKTVVREITMPSIPPRIEFASAGRYLAPSGDFLIPFRFVNVTNISVLAEKLLPQNIVPFVMRETDRYSRWYSYSNDEGDNTDHLTSRGDWTDFPVQSAENKASVVPCSLSKCLKDNHRGVYLVSVRSAKNECSWARRVICASDIGLSLAFEKNIGGTAVIWATSLSTGKSLPGIKISLYADNNELIGEAVSDPSGLVKITVPEHMTPVVAVAFDKKNDDMSFVPVSEETFANIPASSSRKFLENGEYEACLFFDREIFRPGETAFIQALVRDNKAVAPKSFPLELMIYKPDSKLFKKLTLVPDERGSVKTDLEIPEYLPCGHYLAKLKLPGEQGTVIGTKSFKVESFVPPQVKVEVKASSKVAKLGDTVSATVTAEHLFGAPAEGLRSDLYISYMPLEFKPAGWEQYRFGNPNVKYSEGNGDGYSGVVLDENGEKKYDFTIPGDICAPSRLKALLQAVVHENGGRTAAAFTGVEIDTVPYYIGIKNSDNHWIKVGSEAELSWAAVNSDGTPHEGLSSVKASLVKIESHWSFTENRRGTCEWHCEKTEKKIFSEHDVIAAGTDGKGVFKFNVGSSGDYRLTLKDNETGASASYEFYASYWGNELRTSELDSFTKLQISTDKKQYAPGEMANIQIRAPFTGELYLELRKDKVLQTRVVTVTNTTIDVAMPVTASIAPNIQVIATLVRAAKPEEVWAPHRAIGVTSVNVLPPSQVLKVSVAVPEVIKPASTVNVMLNVRASNGVIPDNVRATLFAVDEGICGLTAMKTPDPTKYFFAERFAETPYYDVYTRLMQVTDTKLTGFLSHVGGDEAAALRKRMSPVSARRFKPVSLKTYDVEIINGKAIVPVAVPEFTGQLRFMAIAWTERATGSSEAFARVRRDLVIQPDMPRMLAPGDSSFLSLTLHNTTETQTDVSVTINCSGPVGVSKTPGKIIMAGRTRKTLNIPLTATADVGVGKVSVAVTAPGVQYGETIEIPVRPAVGWQTKSSSSVIQPGKSMEFASESGVLESAASQRFDILSVPACDVRSALGYLTSYPYGCLEQTTSAAFPFLMVSRLPAGYLEDGVLSQADSFITAAVVRDLTMMRYDGFSMWPDSNSVSRKYSLYAIQFLAEAYRNGYAKEVISVDELENVLRYNFRNSTDVTEQCYMALDYALLGDADLALMSRLADRKHELSGECIGMLARAYVLTGEPAAAKELLETTGRPADLRSAAFLLTAWSAVDPENSRCAECIEVINKHKDQNIGHWGTTQDNAIAINAMASYLAVHGVDAKNTKVTASVEVMTGNKKETVVFPAGKSAVWKSTAGQGNAKCRVINNGDSVMYVRRETHTIPMAVNLPVATNGMKVVREYFDRNGRKLDLAKAVRGDIVVVRLTVSSNDSRDDIVVEDLLPACLEVEKENLVLDGTLPWIVRDDSWRWVRHAEFRDDRVLLFSDYVNGGNTYTWYYSARLVSGGDYVVPAVQASAMYDPRVYSRGESTRIFCGF